MTAAVAVCFMWFKAFYWLKMFERTGLYVNLLCTTLVDIKTFMVLFIFILFTFADAIMIMNEMRPYSLY